ncbi:MAG: DUF362 domain-containing protein [Myxococcales bacterium]|nr:DUF362 domain-containing protein [Myxococcales bacterium]MCB9578816.1 DUF362 domain-containing protein [Polyangiaceae bacterium]
MSDRSSSPSELSRRALLGSAAVAGAAATLGRALPAFAEGLPKAEDLTAKRPKGFVPMAAPGKVVKVAAKGDFKSIMQPNLLWPKADVAKRLVEKALMEFTGAPNIVEALGKFIHKDDIVAVKPNGIAGQKGYTQATNYETVLPVVEGLIKLGVKPENIMVYEQYPTYLMGCRINVRQWKLPDGVQTATHNNKNHPMQDVRIYQGIPTRYSKMLLDATAVIDMSMMKDHSICGYTGCLKNITHGNVNNPHDHHAHQASPQIAMLYNHPIVTSRVRLHITDAFKITYDRGPLDKDPNTRIPHGAVYVSTDPVAHDVVGWQVIDAERKKRNIKSLKESKREPRYIQTAGELGLGVADLNQIRLKTYEI